MDDDRPIGVGESARGLVRAVASGNRLTGIELNPLVRERTPPEAAQLICAAINDALASGLPGPDEPPAPDPADVAAALVEVREVGLHTANQVAESVSAAIAQVGARTGIHGDPRPHGLAELLDQALRELHRVDELSAAGVDPVESADGDLRVVVSRPGRLESVTVTEESLSISLGALGARLVAAVNEALDKAEVAARDAAEQGGTDYSDAVERLDQLQESSLNQMRAYVESLSRIMSTIGEP